jgi:DNA mismatch repair protein MutS
MDFAENTGKQATPDLTPMMRQYTAIKDRHPDTVLLYRMGDFFEMFNEDAKIASKVLGLTLTSRNHGGADNTPLAGFPHHALDRYANRLVRAGYRIAICEQTEDPKNAKGVVKRDVIEVITAGTATEDAFIDEKTNNYIMAVSPQKETTGLAVCDLSTGEFFVEETDARHLAEEIARLSPAEILFPYEDDNASVKMVQLDFREILTTFRDGWKFAADYGTGLLKEHFNAGSLEGYGLEGYDAGIGAAGALLEYLKDQKKNSLKHITSISPRKLSSFAELDPSTIRNLELISPMHGDDKGATLISVLDHTGTAMGARKLKKWITHPLKDATVINERLNAVEWLKKDMFTRSEIQLLLKRISDIERLIGRITFERANARDLISLKQSLAVFPSIKKALSNSPALVIKNLVSLLDGFEPVVEMIGSNILENPPLSIREGGLIKPGVSVELDELKDASVNGKAWIAKLQESERARTGISSLKVGYNRVFGYYIEISKSNTQAAPGNYIRKQTLVNGERYITEELKEMESRILGAEEKLAELEYSLFVKLRTETAAWCGRIQKAADAIGDADCISSLAIAAFEYDYSRPSVNDDAVIMIRDGRHPVIERMTSSEQFVPNDLVMDEGGARILLITGPNMAGKSTYLRQNALIAIMAQIGSFVPAAQARIGVVDRFFTRVGASDRLARGQSTFLVEMIEVANILNNATGRSFVLLDEVGRGTSTFDGISIAWAVAEYLHETEGRRARTLFATHYHELTELALMFPGIANFHIKVREWNDKIIFLRKIGEGSCDHSYGIQVARLAGVPKAVIIRAKEILANLENMELTPDHKPVLARHAEKRKAPDANGHPQAVQMNLLDSTGVEILDYLRSLDIDNIKPLDALNMLSELKRKAG